MDAAGLLDDLDVEQRRAVACPSTLVAVIAGAGSGKTRVLTRRVAHRVVTGTADARHTLVLTFTREAAGELRRRLPRLGLTERVEAGTFHSVMLALLRQRWADRNKPAPTVVSDRRRLLAEVTPRGSLDEVLTEVDWAAARGINAARYATAAKSAGRRPSIGAGEVARALEDYATVKRRRGVVDLDDLLVLALDAFREDRDFAEATRWRFRHVLVDEAQDLNPLQHRLVDELRRGQDDLFLVGDPAQAVYGFNGADPTLLVDVAGRFPGVEIVRLRTNHRCTPQIVHAGVHVLDVSGQGAPLVSDRPDGPDVRVVACADEADETAMLVREIRRLEPSLVRRSHVAVLARTHGQLAAIRSALDAAGVPVRRRLDGPGSPYADAIGAAIRLGSAARLRAWAHDVLDGLDGSAGDDPYRREVADAVLDFLREQPLGDGAALRAWLATGDALGGGQADGVDLLTFHAAKGREWHTVFVTGVETGLVPHRSATTQAARAEEARLLYVALTRATDSLVVSWAARRGGYQRRRSPLLDGYEPATSTAVAPPIALVPAGDRREGHRAARALHDDLLAWRERTARASGLVPEAVCSTGVLRAIADARPASADELAELTGVGTLTARRWYATLRDVLDGAQSRRSTTTGA